MTNESSREGEEEKLQKVKVKTERQICERKEDLNPVVERKKKKRGRVMKALESD
jgi:hypothetical protein